MIPFPFQAGQLGKTVSRSGTYYNDFSVSGTISQFTAYQSGSGTTWAISGGRMTASGGSSNQAFLLCDAVSFTNGYVETTMTSSDQAGPVIRGTSAASAYFVACRDGSSLGAQNTIELFKVVAGTFTSLSGNVSVTWPRGTEKRFGINVNGTAINVFADGVSVYSTTDASLSGSTRGGLYCFGALNNSFTDILIQT